MIDTLGFRARAVIGARWFPSKEHSTEDYLIIFDVIAIAIAIARKPCRWCSSSTQENLSLSESAKRLQRRRYRKALLRRTRGNQAAERTRRQRLGSLVYTMLGELGEFGVRALWYVQFKPIVQKTFLSRAHPYKKVCSCSFYYSAFFSYFTLFHMWF